MSYMNPVTDQELLIHEHESNLYIYITDWKKKDAVALTIQVTDPEALAKTEGSKGRGGNGEKRELREGAEEVGGKAIQTTESQEFYC